MAGRIIYERTSTADVTGIATANVVDLLRIRTRCGDGNKVHLIRRSETAGDRVERRMALSNGSGPFDENF